MRNSEMTNFDYKQEVEKYKSLDDVMGKNRLIQRMLKDVIQNILEAEMEDLYGITISPSMVSKITDKVIGAATAWQNRTLDRIYPIVYMDAMHFKVRDDSRIVSKAAYICMAYDMSGHKDILGIWVGESKEAKFWLSVCND